MSDTSEKANGKLCDTLQLPLNEEHLLIQNSILI